MHSGSLSVCVGFLSTVVDTVLFSYVTKRCRKGILPFSMNTCSVNIGNEALLFPNKCCFFVGLGLGS